MLQFFLKKRLIITALAVGAALGTWIFLTCASRQTARFEFNVDDPARFAALELAAPAELYGWRLNDQPVPLPFEGMTYEKIPAIPSSLLVKGRNVLQAAVPLLPPLQAPSPEELEGEVFALEQKGSVFPVRVSGLTISSPCRFTIGPVLGSAGADFFTVACQTNMPVPVSLEVAGRILESPAGAAHCWRVDGLQPGAVYEYRLSAEHPLTGGSVTSGPYHVRTFDEGEDLLFAACGDSRSSPEIWARTAAFICSRKPALFIHTGDMVTEGFLYNAWPREMFDPAAELLSSVPAYPVIGNHEYNADIFQRLLQPPSGLQNWEQRIGPVQIIGIDGALDWSSGSAPYAWLSDVLSKSAAPFIFLVTHYPPYSSSKHGEIFGDKPLAPTARQARDYIVPLLVRYHATAIIAGHSHSYERSELDGGLTLITTAGAGAQLYDKSSNAKTQNPYSSIFIKAHHSTLFQVHGRSCEMKALDAGGNVLDTRTWTARSMTSGQ